MKKFTEKQVVRTRELAARDIERIHRRLFKIYARKEKLLESFLEKAGEQFEAQFEKTRSGQLETKYDSMMQKLLDKLELLQALCPRRNSHTSPPLGFSGCNVCGRIWDDTPPKHY